LVLINIDRNMHGDEIKIVNAKQARQCYIFKNTKRKLLRTNAAVWFNKVCRIRQLQPNYINIKVNGHRRQDRRTATQATRYRINQEIKYLYCKKQQLNKQLYNEHLKCAQLYNGMWPSIQYSIEAKFNNEMSELCDTLNQKLNKLTQNQRGHDGHTQTYAGTRKNRVVNLTNIKLTKEQIKTLEMGPQYAIEKNPKQYLNELIIDTENAIKCLHNGIQNTFRYLAAKRIKQIGESNRHNVMQKRHQYNVNQIKGGGKKNKEAESRPQTRVGLCRNTTYGEQVAERGTVSP